MKKKKRCKHRWSTTTNAFMNAFTYIQVCDKCGEKRFRKWVQDQFGEMG